MDLSRFRKAASYMAVGAVKLELRGDRLFVLKVGEHEVTLRATGECMCTCRHEVYDNTMRRSCAHVMAAQAYIMLRLISTAEAEKVIERARI